MDRRLYAVKKVGLDPFDKETNRKIRREVTTISTLIHKNIVRCGACGPSAFYSRPSLQDDPVSQTTNSSVRNNLD